VAELSAAVRAPALRAAAGGDGAHVLAGRGDRGDVRRDAGDIMDAGARAPALHAAGGGQAAGLLRAAGHGGEAAGCAGHVHGDVAAEDRAVTELLEDVVAPALHRT